MSNVDRPLVSDREQLSAAVSVPGTRSGVAALESVLLLVVPTVSLVARVSDTNRSGLSLM